MLLSVATEILFAGFVFSGHRRQYYRTWTGTLFLFGSYVILVANIYNLFVDLTHLFPQRFTWETAVISVVAITVICLPLGLVLDRYLARYQWWQ